MTTEPFLLDLNVLIALAWPQHVHHSRAHSWFDSLDREWATTPVTEAGFVRLSTNPAVVSETVSMNQARAALDAVRSTPGHVFLPDASSLAEPTISLERLVTSRQVTDAHLVNVAAVSGAVLATFDRGIGNILMPSDRRFVFVLP